MENKTKMKNTYIIPLVLLIIYEFVTFRGVNSNFANYLAQINKNSRIVDFSKSILENLYYLSGVLLVFTVVLGLISLKANKKITDFEKKRHETLITYQICEKFTFNLLPIIDSYFDKYRKEHHLKKIESFVQRFSKFNDLSTGDYNFIIDQLGIDKLSLDYYNESLDLLNKLEIIAFAFNEEIANFENAKSIIASPYITVIDIMKPVLLLESYNDKECYASLISLYNKLSQNKF